MAVYVEISDFESEGRGFESLRARQVVKGLEIFSKPFFRSSAAQFHKVSKTRKAPEYSGAFLVT